MNSYYRKSSSQTKIMKGFASCFEKDKKEAYRPLAEMWLLLVIWCFLYPLKTGTLSWPHVTLVSWLSSTQYKIKLKTKDPSSGCLRIQALLILGMDSWYSYNYFLFSSWILHNIQTFFCSFALAFRWERSFSMVGKCYIPPYSGIYHFLFTHLSVALHTEPPSPSAALGYW